MIRKITLILAFLGMSVGATAQTTLAYDLKVGDKYTIAQRAVQTITQEIPGMTQVIENDLSGTLLFEVAQIHKDTLILNMSFQKFALKMSSPQHGVMMDVDTDSEDTESFEVQMFKGMLNQNITIKMFKTGEIIEVLNGEAILDGMIESLGVDNDAAREQMYAQLGKEWSGEALANSFEQMTYNYPEKAVKIGETWTNEFKGEGKINATNTWRLQKMDDTSATIKGTADITMDLSNPQITMVLEGSQQTTIITSLTSGFPKTIEVNGTAKGDAVSPAMPDQTIPTTIASTTTYTLQ